jgi:hypothetical protein
MWIFALTALFFVGSALGALILMLPLLASLVRVLRARKAFERELLQVQPELVHLLKGKGFDNLLGYFLELERLVILEDEALDPSLNHSREEFRLASSLFRFNFKYEMLFLLLMVGSAGVALFLGSGIDM